MRPRDYARLATQYWTPMRNAKPPQNFADNPPAAIEMYGFMTSVIWDKHSVSVDPVKPRDHQPKVVVMRHKDFAFQFFYFVLLAIHRHKVSVLQQRLHGVAFHAQRNRV